jgi:hypothetical protein
MISHLCEKSATGPTADSLDAALTDSRWPAIAAQSFSTL